MPNLRDGKHMTICTRTRGYYLVLSGKGELYCKPCYAKEFGPTGFGHAGGDPFSLSALFLSVCGPMANKLFLTFYRLCLLGTFVSFVMMKVFIGTLYSNPHSHISHRWIMWCKKKQNLCSLFLALSFPYVQKQQNSLALRVETGGPCHVLADLNHAGVTNFR